MSARSCTQLNLRGLQNTEKKYKQNVLSQSNECAVHESFIPMDSSLE